MSAHASTRRFAQWPWLILAIFVLVAVVGCLFVVANDESLVEQIPYVIAFAMFGIIGAFVLSRAPHNRIGALLLYGSTVTAVAFLCGEVTTYLLRRGRTEGVVVLTAIISEAGWVVGIVPVLLFLPMLFPDGHLPSARWRPLTWLCGAAFVGLATTTLFGLPALTGSTETATVRNPLYIRTLDFEVSDAVISVWLLACLGGSVASLIVRFHRARGIERQQIKWVAASLVFVVASFALSIVLNAFGVGAFIDTVVTALAFLSMPVAVGIGVLQYRLYDLDVVVKKALIAGTLAVIVIAVYAGVVWVFGAFASGGESSVSVFLIALALGVAFRPVSRFARRVADRLVYGQRATPYEVLTEFSERVGDAYASDDVLARMAQILGQGIGATSARVWLLVGGDLRPASSWPSGAAPAAPIPVRGDALPSLHGEIASEVRDGGELLGALSVALPVNDPITPAKEKLVRDLAAQAGLVLRNVRLVAELRASQRRIVAAQDSERRRIERNIHDGAQQQLVALSVKMRLAQALASKDPAKTEAMLAQMQDETQSALEDLRDLARGIYPPLLADKGLSAALEAQSRKTSLPVDVSPDGVTRHEPTVEAAVYFSVLEALQNVAKYADATHAEVRLGEDGGWLTFVVEDDGRGFDTAATRYGTGLQGIADRVSALDGHLEVRSRPGHGTTVTGRIPVAHGARGPS
jgi:signal transduction histidine kinase